MTKKKPDAKKGAPKQPYESKLVQIRVPVPIIPEFKAYIKPWLAKKRKQLRQKPKP